MTTINIQPTLENDRVRIRPLLESDFEALYALASDPLVWAQHPNPDRYKVEVFQNYFRGGIESQGAFLVSETKTGKAIGSSRFYDVDPENSCLVIGYTFFGREYWGGKYNLPLKKLMLDYAFQFVDQVFFHIGAVNLRSQIAIGRLGAKKIMEENITYYGEKIQPNFVYVVEKHDWEELRLALEIPTS
jgi:RimJ/RimL family protein N-acetyltransferase